ncbi:hypothetical protein C0995_005005 [Termitomyces sp. Mi166|nr:hypothetical protein C0995_005005 [Termitomyces sp. Mi166\
MMVASVECPELVIIQEIMHWLKHLAKAKSVLKSCDYFDIIGGVRTGPERFKATTFVSGMKDILKSAGFSVDVLMQEDNPSCKRTYEVRASQGYNCTVVEAACATTATPGFFKAISISSGGLSENFIGASLGYNNPTSLVLHEAELVFGAAQPVACIVSIGAGHSGHISWKPTKTFTQNLVKILLDISTNCEAPIEDLLKLNVEQGLQKMALDDWNRLGEIKAHTVSYLQKAEIIQKVDSLVETLHNGPQKVTLGILTAPSATKEEILMEKLLPVVPAPSSLFIGREDILTQLEKYFVDDSSSLKQKFQQHFVLYGLGGAGKTQIA